MWRTFISTVYLFSITTRAELAPVGAKLFSGNIVAGQGYNQGYNNNGYNGGEGYNPGINNCNNGAGAGNFGPVAFTARKATLQSRNRIGRLEFERTLTSLGGGWSGPSGEFTAPYSGTYHFSWTALSPEMDQLKLGLVRNGQTQINSWADVRGYQAASGGAVLTLRRGDVVSLWVEQGRVYEPIGAGSTGYTTFTGYRIG